MPILPIIPLCLLGWTLPVLTSIALNTSPTLTKLTSSKDIKDIKMCKIFKCLFVEMGCADTPLQVDDALCRVSLYDNFRMADNKVCPWRPCQGFDQPDNQFCLSKQSPCPGIEVPHGLCAHGMHCCSSQGGSPEVLPHTPLATAPKELESNHEPTTESTTGGTSVAHSTFLPTAQPNIFVDTAKCLIPEFPNRRCIKGAFCSFDPAVKVLPRHYCPDAEELCCESLL